MFLLFDFHLSEFINLMLIRLYKDNFNKAKRKRQTLVLNDKFILNEV